MRDPAITQFTTIDCNAGTIDCNPTCPRTCGIVKEKSLGFVTAQRTTTPVVSQIRATVCWLVPFTRCWLADTTDNKFSNRKSTCQQSLCRVTGLSCGGSWIRSPVTSVRSILWTSFLGTMKVHFIKNSRRTLMMLRHTNILIFHCWLCRYLLAIPIPTSTYLLGDNEWV